MKQAYLPAVKFRFRRITIYKRGCVLEVTVRKIVWSAEKPDNDLLEKEWLVTNGLGGYSCGTLAGVLTRRYHALLSAAFPSPLGRVVLLNHIIEHLVSPDGKQQCLCSEQTRQGVPIHKVPILQEFQLQMGLPVWYFKMGECIVEKKIYMSHMQNTVYITYALTQGPALTLKIRPLIDFRKHDASLLKTDKVDYSIAARNLDFQINGDPKFPPLKLCLRGSHICFILDGGETKDIHHFIEADRGYDAIGSLWIPGTISAMLDQSTPFTLIASAESWDHILAMNPAEALEKETLRRAKLIQSAAPAVQHGVGAELVIAADQFIISPVGRFSDNIKAHASGDEVRSVIAGYHWFTDWGRDTMISLEGLTLTTGRFSEAGWILRTFAHYIQDGLIPNLFPEGQNAGLYHTADATLWFFHALHRYLTYTADRFTLKLLLNKLVEIINKHIEGTRFGIGADPQDGLLKQGEQGYQLTWMDAKVEDWVVTPRRGKAVEINALWYNAVKLLEKWLLEEGKQSTASQFGALANKIYQSFNLRFWNEDKGYLYDVIDGENGDDNSCRPNQLLAISLDFPVLEQKRWVPVLETITKELFTPLGLRTLSPQHPDFKPKYFGDLRARDAAYHQGTVWAWLIGPYIDAWLKVYPNQLKKAREFLGGFQKHLSDACIGSVSEVFDAQPPFTPRGCVAQAWSVAEVLRCLVKTSSTGFEQ